MKPATKKIAVNWAAESHQPAGEEILMTRNRIGHDYAAFTQIIELVEKEVEYGK